QVAGGPNEARRNAATWALEQMLNDDNEAQRERYRAQLVQTAFTPNAKYVKPAMMTVVRLTQQDKSVSAQVVPRLMEAAFTPDSGLVEPAMEALTELVQQDKSVSAEVISRLMKAAFTPDSGLVEPAIKTLAVLSQQDETVSAKVIPRLMEAAFTPSSNLVEPAMGALTELARQDESVLAELMKVAFTPNAEYVKPAMETLAVLSQQDETVSDKVIPRLMEAAFTPNSNLVEPAMEVLATLAPQDKSVLTAIVSRLPGIVAKKHTPVSQAIVALLTDNRLAPLVAGWLDYLLAKVPGMSLYMARYPVTNAQYRRFVEEDGYKNEKWWSEAGWQWRHNPSNYRQKSVVEPEYWTDEKWNGPTLPVVGVSWYEAEAYCNWLTEYTGRECRLPTGKEWQQAAQGDDGRKYPWGNNWQKGVCNTSEAGLKRTSPVGQFSPDGDSPPGCADMSGNVWEWCSDWSDEKEQMFRVLRGGSWYYDQALARCDSRSGHYPDNGYNYYGFRVVSPIF
ncbi:MAG: formylglycine-generating enzyme family protein, partial [Chloroflexi bacterium]|nr:formylglycine-generating enzyme family protein [Chloroflexota bacterium]